MLRGLSQDERKVLRQCLDEFGGLTAGRHLTVCGLDGSEVQLPLDDNMTLCHSWVPCYIFKGTLNPIRNTLLSS